MKINFKTSISYQTYPKWAARFSTLVSKRRWPPITSTFGIGFFFGIGESDKMSSIKPYSWPPFVEF